MTFYKNNENQLVVYSNHDDTRLNVNDSVIPALKQLGFSPVADDRVAEGRLKLVIWHGGHGEFPNEV